jgi:hypothetical protein
VCCTEPPGTTGMIYHAPAACDNFPMSVGLDNGILGDTLFRFWRRDYGQMWRQRRWSQGVFEWLRPLEHNTPHPLSLYCPLGELLYKADESLSGCVCIRMNCPARWLTEPFFGPRACVIQGEHIEVMVCGYSGPHHFSMPSIAACRVDQSGIMTSTTPV